MTPAESVLAAAIFGFVGGLIVGGLAMLQVVLEDRKRKAAEGP